MSSLYICNHAVNCQSATACRHGAPHWPIESSHWAGRTCVRDASFCPVVCADTQCVLVEAPAKGSRESTRMDAKDSIRKSGNQEGMVEK